MQAPSGFPGRFTIWDVLGETVLVTVHVALGYVFIDSVAFVAEITGDMMGMVVALVVAISAAL